MADMTFAKPLVLSTFSAFYLNRLSERIPRSLLRG
jgi:hypothetical protein